MEELTLDEKKLATKRAISNCNFGVSVYVCTCMIIALENLNLIKSYKAGMLRNEQFKMLPILFPEFVEMIVNVGKKLNKNYEFHSPWDLNPVENPSYTTDKRLSFKISKLKQLQHKLDTQ